MKAPTIEEAQDDSDLMELRGSVEDALQDISHAESCETLRDFRSNIDNVINNLELALSSARALETAYRK